MKNIIIIEVPSTELRAALTTPSRFDFQALEANFKIKYPHPRTDFTSLTRVKIGGFVLLNESLTACRGGGDRFGRDDAECKPVAACCNHSMFY